MHLTQQTRCREICDQTSINSGMRIATNRNKHVFTKSQLPSRDSTRPGQKQKGSTGERLTGAVGVLISSAHNWNLCFPALTLKTSPFRISLFVMASKCQPYLNIHIRSVGEDFKQSHVGNPSKHSLFAGFNLDQRWTMETHSEPPPESHGYSWGCERRAAMTEQNGVQ